MLTLKLLPLSLAVIRLPVHEGIPDWVFRAEFFSVTRTYEELSIVCPQDQIQGNPLLEKEFRAFQVQGPLDFSLTGILSSLLEPLAKEKISVFTFSTYDTDYILVKEPHLSKVIEIFQRTCQIMIL